MITAMPVRCGMSWADSWTASLAERFPQGTELPAAISRSTSTSGQLRPANADRAITALIPEKSLRSKTDGRKVMGVLSLHRAFGDALRRAGLQSPRPKGLAPHHRDFAIGPTYWREMTTLSMYRWTSRSLGSLPPW